MFCGNCGKEIKEGNKFCTNCGAEVNNTIAEGEINKCDTNSSVCELEKKINEHDPSSFKEKFEYVSNVLYDFLYGKGIDCLIENLNNCSLCFVMDNMYHFNKMIFNDKNLNKNDKDKYISWLSDKTSRNYIDKLCNDKRNIFDEFSDFIKDKDYDDALLKVLNFSKIPINKIELLFGFFQILDSDDKYYNELYNKKQSDPNGIEYYDSAFNLNYVDKTVTKIYKLVNDVLEKVYTDNKTICDEIINNINNSKKAFDEWDDSWCEENIPGYEKGAFNYESLAKSIIENQMYTKEQVLASFYKSGNNVCTKLFFEEIDKQN